MGEPVQQTWDYIGARMVHTHVKDARRNPDGGWQLVRLGQGEVPVRAALATWAAERLRRLRLRRVGEEVAPGDRGAGGGLPEQHIATLRRPLPERGLSALSRTARRHSGDRAGGRRVARPSRSARP